MTYLKRLSLSLMLCLSWLIISSEAQASDTLRVATYNVRVATGGDTGNRNWDMRKAHVADIIENVYQFDIFGVQELSNTTQLNELMAYLSDTYNVFSRGVGSTDGSSGTRNAIIYKKSRLTLLNSGGFFLSPTHDVVSIGWDAKLNRACVWAKMLDNATNKQFYFFSAHFDHVGDEARRQSAKLIIAKITEIMGAEDLPVFFVGDLNTQPDKIPISNIINGGLIDSRTQPLAKNIFGPVGTTNGWNKSTSVLTNRIDYIFVNEKTDVHAYHTITQKYYTDAYPSDHFPVMIKAVLTNKVIIPRIKSNEVLLGEYTFTTGTEVLKPSGVQNGFQLSDIYLAPEQLQATFENDALQLTNWSTGFQMTSGKSVQFSVSKNSSVLQYDVTRVDIKLKHGGSDGIVMHYGSAYNSATRTTNLNSLQISKDSMVTIVMQEGVGSSVTSTPVVTNNNPFCLSIGTRSALPTDIVSIDHIKVYGTVTGLAEDFSGYDAIAITGDLTQAPRISNDVAKSKQAGWSAQNTYAFKAGTGYIATLLLGPTATDSAYITTPMLDLSQAFMLNFSYRSRMGSDINPDGRLSVYLNDSLLIWEGQTTQTTMENVSSIAFVGTPDNKITFTVPTVAGNEMMFDNVSVVRSSQPALNLPLHQTISLGKVPLQTSRILQIPLKAANLSREITLGLSDGINYQITSPTEIDKTSAEAGTQITVNFTPPASPGLYTDTIMVSSANMTARTIILKTVYDQYNELSPLFDPEIFIQDKTITVQNLSGRSLQLYTITGVLINEVGITDNTTRITAPSAGCYILRITTGNRPITKKILIQ